MGSAGCRRNQFTNLTLLAWRLWRGQDQPPARRVASDAGSSVLELSHNVGHVDAGAHRRPRQTLDRWRQTVEPGGGGTPTMPFLRIRRMSGRFQNHVERRSGGTTDLGEAAGADHFGDSRLAGLGTKRGAGFLR